MASAWGVNVSQPLIILVHILSISKYLEGLGTYFIFYVQLMYIHTFFREAHFLYSF